LLWCVTGNGWVLGVVTGKGWVLGVVCDWERLGVGCGV
jgi:hypothetical protein